MKVLTLETFKAIVPGERLPEGWSYATKCLIWSGEHQAYWRPTGQGYTEDIAKAGVYTYGSAWDSTQHCGPEKKISFEIYEEPATTETKSGKECDYCKGKGKLEFIDLFNGQTKEVQICPKCHGLGKVFAPGDALTWQEAEKVWGNPEFKIQISHPRWGINWRDREIDDEAPGLVDKGYVFRLAPAPQEEPYTGSDLRPSDMTEARAEDERLKALHSKEESAVKVENVIDAAYNWSYTREGELCGVNSGFAFQAGANWVLSLTPAQLEQLRKERA